MCAASRTLHIVDPDDKVRPIGEGAMLPSSSRQPVAVCYVQEKLASFLCPEDRLLVSL